MKINYSQARESENLSKNYIDHLPQVTTLCIASACIQLSLAIPLILIARFLSFHLIFFYRDVNDDSNESLGAFKITSISLRYLPRSH